MKVAIKRTRAMRARMASRGNKGLVVEVTIIRPPLNINKRRGKNTHHALRPVSWSRRIVTARLGMRTAKVYIEEKTPTPKSLLFSSTSMRIKTRLIRRLVNMNIQYSSRRARPEKTAYILSTEIYQFI